MYNNLGMGMDFPMGLAALLAMDPVAMNRFDALGDDERMGIFDYLNSGTDEADRNKRLDHTVRSLRDGVPGFYRQ